MSDNTELVRMFASPDYKFRYTQAKSKCICICCGKRVEKFNDSYTRLEYSISALCQNCQGKFFKANA